MGLSDYGGYGADNRADDSATAFAVVTFVLAVELEGLFPRGRAEVVLDYDISTVWEKASLSKAFSSMGVYS